MSKEITKESNWRVTTNRFVAFFDILGFKDMVLQSSHQETLDKLAKLKSKVDKFDNLKDLSSIKELNIDSDQTKSITFSDSFIFFSKSDEHKDAVKILVDFYVMLKVAMESGLSIKGALSYGEITVDFDKSLFFGQAIIDSYLLHEELQMLTVILDHKFEVKFQSFPKNDFLKKVIIDYKANLKSGRITHKLLKPDNVETIEKRIKSVSDLYKSTSGRSRIYLDNTLDFYSSIKL